MSADPAPGRPDDAASAYARLSPDTALDCLEALGYVSDGRILELNSYENRVLRIGMEDGPPLVAKFYRPGRWSDAAIREEHALCAELTAAEITDTAPLAAAGGETLHRVDEYRIAVYPCVGGRAPELEDLPLLEQLGRLLGRMHALGSVRRFQARPVMDPAADARDAMEAVLASEFLPASLSDAYTSLVANLMEMLEQRFAAVETAALRLHGDFHSGNLLCESADRIHIVDFDDACMGPAVQDLWLLLPEFEQDRRAPLAALLEGYREFFDFDERQLTLIEPLRTLRIMRYAAWIARRWHDPAFPRAFPHFAQPRFWDEHVLLLREQAARLLEPDDTDNVAY